MQPRAPRAPAASDQPEQPDLVIEQSRAVVLDSLDLLRVPSPLKLIADVLAVQGQRVTLRQLARLRHTHRREHHSAGERFLVPPLSTFDLTPLSGSLAVSTWPAEQRLVGSRSARVHHLRVLLALLDLDTSGERLSAMVARHAETIPGALVRGEARDPERIRAAAARELEALASLDADERRAVAARLETLPSTYQLWGRPALLDGGLEAAQSETSSEDQP
jgi:hypothetical protein